MNNSKSSSDVWDKELSTDKVINVNYGGNSIPIDKVINVNYGGNTIPTDKVINVNYGEKLLSTDKVISVDIPKNESTEEGVKKIRELFGFKSGSSFSNNKLSDEQIKEIKVSINLIEHRLEKIKLILDGSDSKLPDNSTDIVINLGSRKVSIPVHRNNQSKSAISNKSSDTLDSIGLDPIEVMMKKTAEAERYPNRNKDMRLLIAMQESNEIVKRLPKYDFSALE